MATTIRLTRMGKKKRPFYRLVVTDSRKRRDGAYLANLGFYNPFVEPYEINLHVDECVDWLGKGAEMSTTARSLLKKEGILYKFSLVKQGLAPEEIEAKMEAWKPSQEARLERQAAAVRDHQRQLAEAEQKRRDDAAKAAAAEAEAEKGGDAAEAAGDAAEAPQTEGE